MSRLLIASIAAVLITAAYSYNLARREVDNDTDRIEVPSSLPSAVACACIRLRPLVKPNVPSRRVMLNEIILYVINKVAQGGRSDDRRIAVVLVVARKGQNRREGAS